MPQGHMPPYAPCGTALRGRLITAFVRSGHMSTRKRPGVQMASRDPQPASQKVLRGTYELREVSMRRSTSRPRFFGGVLHATRSSSLSACRRGCPGCARRRKFCAAADGSLRARRLRISLRHRGSRLPKSSRPGSIGLARAPEANAAIWTHGPRPSRWLVSVPLSTSKFETCALSLVRRV